ncbi:MAG TPA: hypothetical protein PLM70_09195 [Bacteroidales bacterium]|nr:hypothetical protein [Bacteroidales bacterium]
MKYIKFILLSVIIASLFSSCDDEFSLNAPYKDITIVYGLLNVKDSVHYVKVYKGFQTEGNSYTAAGDWTNLYYFDKIKVTIEEFNNNVATGRIIELDTTTQIPREPGSFANPKQLLYYTNATLNPAYSYQIKVLNKETGRIVTGMTPLVPAFAITAPNIPTNNGLNLTGKKGNIIFPNNELTKGYEIYENFYYFEVSKVTGEITKYGSVKRDITNNNMLTSTSSNFGEINKEYNPSSIYDVIALQVKADPTVDRYRMATNAVSIEVWGASLHLYNYLIINQPSSSIVQEHLEYTNLVCPSDSSYKTAYGVFASRYKAVKSYNISAASEDSLVLGSKTSHLGFKFYRDYDPR